MIIPMHGSLVSLHSYGGVWIGCDDRFIRLEGGLGYGGQAARPIYEYFFKKALADKTLGLDRRQSS